MFNAKVFSGVLLIIAGCGQSHGGSDAVGGSTAQGGITSGGSGSGDAAGATQSGAGGAPAMGGASGAGGSSSAIACERDSFTTDTNEKRIGAGCSRGLEIASCGVGTFCTARVLDDRWPRSDETPESTHIGHCTKHCDTDSDCGSGHTCCGARATGAFCLTVPESPLVPTGCSEPCASNHLGCSDEQICCERLGRICVSEHCSGVCLD